MALSKQKPPYLKTFKTDLASYSSKHILHRGVGNSPQGLPCAFSMCLQPNRAAPILVSTVVRFPKDIMIRCEVIDSKLCCRSSPHLALIFDSGHDLFRGGGGGLGCDFCGGMVRSNDLLWIFLCHCVLFCV